MRLLFTNSVTLNGGDAAIVRAMRLALNEPLGDFEMVVYDSQPDVAARHNPDLDFAGWPYLRMTLSGRLALIGPALQRANETRLRTAAGLWGRGLPGAAGLLLRAKERTVLSEYAAADALISTGGTYLVENYPLAPHLLDYELALALGRPLILYTQSLGPFRQRRNRRRMRRIIRRSSAVLLRDARSLEHVRDLGVEGPNVHVFADAAFALADPDALEQASQRPLPRGDRLQVAISVRDWKHFGAGSGMAAFEAGIAAAVCRLVELHDAEVTFISTCQGVPEYHADDSAVAARIVDRLPAKIRERVRVDHHHHSTADLLAGLHSYDLAIATRMHFAILALCAGVPVLPIAYEFKTQELFTRLGQEHAVWPIEAVGDGRFPEAVSDFIAQIPADRERLFSQVERERQSARQAAQVTARTIRTAAAPVGNKGDSTRTVHGAPVVKR